MKSIPIRNILANMRRSRVWMPVIVIAISIAVTVLLTLTRAPLEIQRAPTPVIPIEVMEVQPRAVKISLRSHGNVMPYRQTVVGAEISGKIVEVLDSFFVGAFFKKGDVLMHIDDRDYQAEVKQAQSSVSSARSKLALEQGLTNAALRDWRALHTNKSVAEVNPLTLRKPQLEEAEARLESALATLQKAEFNLDRTIIRAPYNGLVRERYVEVGQYVSLSARLGLLYATDYAEIRLPLPEQQLNYIDIPQVGSQVYPLVSLSVATGGQTHRWYARVMRTENVLDERSRTLFVVASVEDPYGLDRDNHLSADYVPLRYGTFVQALVNGRTMEDLVVLPRDLLLNQDTIWVVEESRLSSRVVDVLQTEGENIYVRDGLKAGELVNLTPLGTVLSGTEVTIVKQLPPADLRIDDIDKTPHQNTMPLLKFSDSEQPLDRTNNASQMERLVP